MRNRFRYVFGALATTALLGSVFLVGAQSQGGQRTQGSMGEMPRTVDGKPDFSGIWQAAPEANWDLRPHAERPIIGQPGVYADVPILAAPVVALGSAGWVPASLGFIEGNEIPYQPWAAKRQQENFANWADRDPELRCYYPGVPRAMYLPYKFQIIQGTTKVMMAFEFRNADRTIHLDEVVPYPAEAWMGHSVGRWDGDALVVDVSSFTPYTWLDRAGNFHSDALKVTERYTALGRNAIQYEARIEDSKVFTRPWTIRVPLYRRLEQNASILPFRCMEHTEETFLGHLRKNPTLVKPWESKTMRIEVTRKVPPIDELYETTISGNPE